MQTDVARQMWLLTETIHAVVYFAPDAKEIYASAGLKGGWMGYFASRSAPMGPVPAEVVEATFYNFHPAMIRRSIPDAWKLSSPERVLEARTKVVDSALGRLFAEVDEATVRDAASLASDAAQACGTVGRPLFAGHASLRWPESDHLRLWHACTLLREYRGDGHVAALTTAGLDGCEAHVTVVATGQVPAEAIRPYRGWPQDEWVAAEQRLRDRGLLDDSGRATEAGRALREGVERRTDELAMAPWRHIGDDGCRRLRELLIEPVRAVKEGGGVPFPNPIGLLDPLPE